VVSPLFTMSYKAAHVGAGDCNKPAACITDAMQRLKTPQHMKRQAQDATRSDRAQIHTCISAVVPAALQGESLEINRRNEASTWHCNCV
jgi:hypothetical protein